MADRCEIPKAYEPAQAEGKWYRFWEERGYFRGKIDPNKKPFAIVIPPPNITGRLHIGHALNNTLQDIVIRYKRMDGYAACWFPGIDHAGIATQNVVERELAKEGKTRHALGREAFIKRVWDWKAKYGNEIVEQLKVLGASCDWDRLRFTLDEGLSKAVREVFVRLYEEGFIYRGERIINWCPRCATALSDIEVVHQEHQDKLYYIKYPLADGGSITVATTRPETMLGDTAVAVHPDDERYKKLVGKQAILPLLKRKIPVIADEAVAPGFGTGAVKVTPAHDQTDFEIGERHKLERINILNEDATLNENAGPYAGLERYAARERVLEDLKREGLLERVEDYTHAVGHCQRCDTVIEPLVSTQWFVEMEELAKPAIEAVRSGRIRLIPSHWEKVYFDWLENIRDWCISRQLWWGHRIPAWYCRDCNEVTVSRETPRECVACGSKDLYQDEDVLDTWFSSALWPFSVMGWPEETPELRYFYPTALLSTAPEILFFWVARMVMMGLHFIGEIPFREVLLHPTVKDERGRRMSKSLGTGIDPLELKEQYGMDALRFTLAASMSKGQDMRLSPRDLEGYRKFLNKIWNASRLALLNLEDFQPAELVAEELELEDRWILSRLARQIGELRRNLESYDFNFAAEGLYNFVWHDFCDWYLEMIKPRLYGEERERKRTAQEVLYRALVAILKMLHPFIPYITEEIWQLLPAKEADSVMIAPFPQVERAWIDPEVERKMATLQELISAIRTIRSEMNVPPQAPARALIRAEDQGIRELVEANRVFFRELAGVHEFAVGHDIERPEHAPRIILEGAEVFVPLEGLIDLGQERARLARELAEVQRTLSESLRKLEDERFLQRAPQEIVEKEQAKARELRERAERLTRNLQVLGA
ncbi:MAG: valine--tRNA ligase [Candidatus Acetothermia bacterium]|jgi:valyl-tRNA synthetase|nr:valine--tRNA ligase [Candidatus Acetothermia bacterium]MDH7504560.1 valine--tRNA ligase [Candidatus Acetothermia bacterium]